VIEELPMQVDASQFQFCLAVLRTFAEAHSHITLLKLDFFCFVIPHAGKSAAKQSRNGSVQ